jgi:hypothetical protein
VNVLEGVLSVFDDQRHLDQLSLFIILINILHLILNPL